MRNQYQEKFDKINEAWEKVYSLIVPTMSADEQKSLAITVFSGIMPNQRMIQRLSSEFSHIDHDTGVIRRILTCDFASDYFGNRMYSNILSKNKNNIVDYFRIGKDRIRYVEISKPKQHIQNQETTIRCVFFANTKQIGEIHMDEKEFESLKYFLTKLEKISNTINNMVTN